MNDPLSITLTISGARRQGKTTITRALRETLLKEGYNVDYDDLAVFVGYDVAYEKRLTSLKERVKINIIEDSKYF